MVYVSVSSLLVRLDFNQVMNRQRTSFSLCGALTHQEEKCGFTFASLTTLRRPSGRAPD